jgi:hypothetical protein
VILLSLTERPYAQRSLIYRRIKRTAEWIFSLTGNTLGR